MTSMFRSERGSIMPLLIGCCVLVLALILGGVSATSLYLERKRLLTIADGAALVAAESYDLSLPPTVLAGSQPVFRLSASSVAAGARSYFGAVSSANARGISLVSATTLDARTATVRVRAIWHPPVVSYFFPVAFPLEAQSSARAVSKG